MGRTMCIRGHWYNSGMEASCPTCKAIERGEFEPGSVILCNDPKSIEITRRLDRDAYFMEIAKTVAKRGTCPRARVGAVVVDSSTNRIVGAGYNGSPPHHPHCLDVGCKLIEIESKTYCIRTIHAEVNALLTVRDHSDTLILYTTHFPCFECIKVIAAKGIREVMYLGEYKDPKWEMIKDEYRDLTFTQVSL